MTNTVTLHRNGNGTRRYYANTPQGRIEIVPDYFGDQITAWKTYIDTPGYTVKLHSTLADVREWIARGGQ